MDVNCDTVKARLHYFSAKNEHITLFAKPAFYSIKMVNYSAELINFYISYEKLTEMPVHVTEN